MGIQDHRLHVNGYRPAGGDLGGLAPGVRPGLSISKTITCHLLTWMTCRCFDGVQAAPPRVRKRAALPLRAGSETPKRCTDTASLLTPGANRRHCRRRRCYRFSAPPASTSFTTFEETVLDVAEGFWVRDYGGGVLVGRPFGARWLAP